MKTKIGDILSRALKRFVGTFLLSLLFFNSIKIKVDFYLTFFLLLGMVVIFFYKNTKNPGMLTGLLMLGSGNLSAFLLVCFIQNGWPGYLFEQGAEAAFWRKAILFSICVAELFVIGIKLFYYYKCENKEHCQQPELFEARKHDISRILDYLPRVEVLGLNGAWGSGKSFLVERLCENEKIQQNYEILRIDLLSCSLDKVEEIVLSGIDNILHQNGVLSGHSIKLRKALGENGLLLQLKSLLFQGEATMSAAFKNLQQDAKNLNKNILLIYEDIDRIGDKELICKIFDISNKLAGEKIKVLYLYDGENLENLKLDRRYLEKFIPYIINISDVPYLEMARWCYKSYGLKELGVKEEEVCYLEGEIYRDYNVRRLLNLNISFQYRMYGVTMRKVEIFLQELKVMLTENKEFQKDENRKVVIAFLFMKHFHYEFYEKLSVKERMLNLLKFKAEDAEYTLPQLMYERKRYQEDPQTGMSNAEIENLFQKQENCDLYGILTLFDYRFEIIDWKTSKDEQPHKQEQDAAKRLHSIRTEDNESIHKRNHNEKIDRLVWNLYANGRSEYTNMEKVVDKIYQDVLVKPPFEWKEAEQKFLQDMFMEENVGKDNESFFLYGVKWQVFIFQAFRTIGASEEQWLALLKYYFARRVDKTIEYDLMDVLHYCDMRHKKVLFMVVEEFLKYRIIGNLNKEKNYYTFLKEALKGIQIQGYETRYEAWMLSYQGECIASHEEITLRTLDDVKYSLEREFKKHWTEAVDKDLEQLIGFIEKNQEMIKQKEAVTRKKSGSGITRMHTQIQHNNPEIYAALEKMTGQAEFQEAVNKAYATSEIQMYELKILMEKHKEKMEKTGGIVS